MPFQLAQVNIGRLAAPINDPRSAEFVTQLDPINALAERSPGFVWRLQSASGNATDVPYNDDPLTMVNLSVWESVESLRAFTYQSDHVKVMRLRAQWFEKMTRPHSCLWWIPSGHLPTVADARERLEHYQQNGATPTAFWFQETFQPPSEA